MVIKGIPEYISEEELKDELIKNNMMEQNNENDEDNEDGQRSYQEDPCGYGACGETLTAKDHIQLATGTVKRKLYQ